MRVVSKIVGVLFLIIGIPVLVAGAAAAIFIGNDNVVRAQDIKLDGPGVAVVTAPKLISIMGPTLTVTARAQTDQEIFLGVAHTDDTESYFEGTPHRVINSVNLPKQLGTHDTEGDRDAVTKPGGLDWWVAQDSGKDGADLSWTMANGAYSLVIMNASGKSGIDATAEVGIQIKGMFETAMLIVGGGFVVILLAVGFLILGRKRRPTPAPAEGVSL